MEERIKILEEACVGCGQCVKDCPSKIIKIDLKKATLISNDCIKCGHCIAICPTKAVEIEALDMSEVIEYDHLSESVNDQELMDMFKSLRTIRAFKEQEVEIDKIKTIIEAGRYTATARNRQGVRYIVVKDTLQELEQKALMQLRFLQKAINTFSKLIRKDSILSRYDFKDGFLFKNANVLILAVSEDTHDGALATKSMELMIKALGLGSLQVGIFTAIAKRSKSIGKYMGLVGKEKIVGCLAIGYPDIQYKRTVPRRKARITWQ